MTYVVDSRGEYYHIIEDIYSPFGEKGSIILKDFEVYYRRNVVNSGINYNLDIEMVEKYISLISEPNYESTIEMQNNLQFLRETLSKMISYKREAKINEVLSKTRKEEYKGYA